MKTDLPPSTHFLAVIQGIQSRTPSWQHALRDASQEATGPHPDLDRVRQCLEAVATTPSESSNEMIRAAQDLGITAEAALGIHAALAETDLAEVSRSWQAALDAAGDSKAPEAAAAIQAAAKSLTATLQHVIFITFLDEARRGRVGSGRRIDSYGNSWHLQPADLNQLWSWLLEDPKVFDGEPLPLVLDTTNRSIYRKPQNLLKRNIAAAAPVWGAFVVFAITALVFELLHRAGITSWQKGWGWKMLVLVLCVSGGAFAHIGARALDVNYNDPMKVEDAGSVLDWLSLRYLTVMHMYAPVLLVTIALWGAGNVPRSFKELGTALLAGYSADSAESAAISRLGKQKSDA